MLRIALTILALCTVQLACSEQEAHSIDKRAVTTFVNIMNTFQRAQTCCNVPALLANANSTCSSLFKGRYIVITRGVFAAWQSIGYSESATESGAAHACFTDCIFNYYDLIDNSTTGGVLNNDSITAYFDARTSGSWSEPVANATEFCLKNLAAKPAEATTVRSNGRVCSTLPIKLMVCMRRQMLLNCPGQPASVACREVAVTLKRVGPFMGLNMLF